MLGRSFDPSRPVVASSSFQAGEDVVAAGDAFDWRARGMTQLEALAMFSAGLLVHPPADPVVVGMRKLSEAIESETAALRKATTTISVTPGERVDVETPSQQRKRRSKA